MVDFLQNLSASKLVDEYYVTNPESLEITIRVIEAVSGAQDFTYKAFPYFAKLDAPATPEYQGVGTTPEEALQACLQAINGVPLSKMIALTVIELTAVENAYKHQRTHII